MAPITDPGGRLLPYFAQDQRVGIFLLDTFTEQFQEGVRNLIRYIQPEACATFSDPVRQDAIRTTYKGTVGQIILIDIGQAVKVPPTFVEQGLPVKR